jgi:hypothetical protein
MKIPDYADDLDTDAAIGTRFHDSMFDWIFDTEFGDGGLIYYVRRLIGPEFSGKASAG